MRFPWSMRRPDISERERQAVVDAYHSSAGRDPIGILRSSLEESKQIRLGIQRNVRMLIVVAIAALVVAMWALVGYFISRGHDHQRVQQLGMLAGENHKLALYAKGLAEEIQTQRKSSILLTCRQENQRHAEVLRGFAAFAQRNPDPSKPSPKPGTPAAARQTLVLDMFVDIGWPHRDCSKRLRELTRVATPHRERPHTGHVRGIVE